MRLIACIIVSAALWIGCSQKPSGPLPIIGNFDVNNGDTIYHTIPGFLFYNQDSVRITNETFSGQAYVTDFFFTSCPSICPKVKKEMLYMYERYHDNKHLAFVSHSMDVKRDTVGRLKEYAENLEVSSKFWHFVTGDKDQLFDMADQYFISALEDPGAPGGFDHSGRLILVDKNRHVRAYCNGTEHDEVVDFMKDIDRLLDEMGE